MKSFHVFRVFARGFLIRADDRFCQTLLVLMYKMSASFFPKYTFANWIYKSFYYRFLYNDCPGRHFSPLLCGASLPAGHPTARRFRDPATPWVPEDATITGFDFSKTRKSVSKSKQFNFYNSMAQVY